MTLDSTTELAVAELVIYLVLIPIIVYNFIRHGKTGWLGWGYLVVFCGIRVASDGIQISDHHKETQGKSVGDAGAIVSSIGTSPLLLGLAGVLHESSVVVLFIHHSFPFPWAPLFFFISQSLT